MKFIRHFKVMNGYSIYTFPSKNTTSSEWKCPKQVVGHGLSSEVCHAGEEEQDNDVFAIHLAVKSHLASCT